MWVNDNGVMIIETTDGITHASFYQGEGVTYKKTFANITREQQEKLTAKDLI
jgi:hypothetical protein